MNIKLLAPANADLVNGYHFYEAQAQGLGAYFRDSLFSDIDSLMIYHGIHSKYLDKYYKMLSKRFPFAIYYTIEERDLGCVCHIGLPQKSCMDERTVG